MKPTPESSAPQPKRNSREAPTEHVLREQVLAAIALLQSIDADRTLLALIESSERTELLKVAGQVARPGPWAKRELARAVRRRRRDELRAADEKLLSCTGIRKKRQEPVFQTPKFGRPPVRAGDDIDALLANPTAAPTKRIEAGETPNEKAQDPASSPLERILQEPRTCYVCKVEFRELHFFYDSMCASCAELNWTKRHQTADLRGRVALVTGSRVKIGYQAAIMLLRAGAAVVVATRFPRDAAARYAAEADFADWSERLQIHGIDLRHTPSVEAFASHLDATLDRLDYIINNACQTVRRPAGFYGHLIEAEQTPFATLPGAHQQILASYESMRQQTSRPALASAALTAANEPQSAVHHVGLHDPAALSQVALLAEDLDRGSRLFPAGQLDADLQQVDLRGRNSWRLAMHEVSAVELLEVQLVNAVAPFILNARLKPLMLRHASRDKHIVNVSAMEGQFYRSYKTDKHPHTNMAKAALNMMTRTSAVDYVAEGIHMNSVDTGWVTDEDPAEIAARKVAMHRFHPPLDIVDGAARICDPIFNGATTGKHIWGRFLKDYAPTDW